MSDTIRPSESIDRPVIAILGGTGKEGPGLALRWAHAGYPVVIGSRQAEKARLAADEINSRLGTAGGVPVGGLENGEAVRQADICVLTVVQSAHQAALEGLKETLQGKILVDATARVDYRDPRPPSPPSAARHAQELLGSGVRVVAAFQNVPAHVLRKDLDQPIETDVLVCADDSEAAEIVIALAKGGGMRAYYAGGLDNAVVVEGLTSLLISLNKRYGVKTATINISGLDSGNIEQV
jgi:8-hydroxy-5-deazaflavin:NADPH oxidoreductase